MDENIIPEIEVTPEMIAAAVKIMGGTYDLCNEALVASIAQEVFQSMVAKAREQQGHDKQ